MKKVIRCPAPHLLEVRRLAEDGQKINAIKHLRIHGKSFPPRDDVDGEPPNHSVGLRDAKIAVEGLMGQVTMGEVRIAPILRIKSFKIETEEGVVEVDLDELQLRLLEGLSELPLDAISEMVEVVAFIRQWQGEEV